MQKGNIMINTKTLSTKSAFIMFTALEEIKEPRKKDFLLNKNYERAVEIFWKNMAMYHFYKRSLPEYVNEKVNEYNNYRSFLRKDSIKSFKLPNLKVKSTKFVKLEYYKIYFATNKVLRYKKRLDKKIDKIKKRIVLYIIREAVKKANSQKDVIILSNTDYIPQWYYNEVQKKASKTDDGSILGIPDIIVNGYRCVAFVPEKINLKKVAKNWTPYNVLDTVCIYVPHNY